MGIKALKLEALNMKLNGHSENSIVNYVYQNAQSEFQAEIILTKVLNY